jgi:hypothetical protein
MGRFRISQPGGCVVTSEGTLTQGAAMTTILIIVVVVLLLGGGGFYGFRGRW